MAFSEPVTNIDCFSIGSTRIYSDIMTMFGMTRIRFTNYKFI